MTCFYFPMYNFKKNFDWFISTWFFSPTGFRFHFFFFLQLIFFSTWFFFVYFRNIFLHASISTISIFSPNCYIFFFPWFFSWIFLTWPFFKNEFLHDSYIFLQDFIIYKLLIYFHVIFVSHYKYVIFFFNTIHWFFFFYINLYVIWFYLSHITHVMCLFEFSFRAWHHEIHLHVWKTLKYKRMGIFFHLGAFYWQHIR